MNVDWARYATVRELLEELENRAKCEIFMNQVAGSLSDVCDYYRRALPDTVLGHRAENPEGLLFEDVWRSTYTAAQLFPYGAIFEVTQRV